MKTLLFLAVALGVPAVLFADDQTVTAAQQGHGVAATGIAAEGKPGQADRPDRFTMSAGSVAAIRGSHSERLTNDVKLLDGTILTPGGTVRLPDGSETQLADGQSINMDGKLGPVPPAARTNGGPSEPSQAAKK
jgi:hypothetical protein